MADGGEAQSVAAETVAEAVGKAEADIVAKSAGADAEKAATRAVVPPCPHQNGTGEACLDCQNMALENASSAFQNAKKEFGLDHDVSMTKLFDLFDQYIQAYKLSACDDLLAEAQPVAQKRGKGHVFYTKYVQARAFLLFKQFRFRESAQMFEIMAELVPPCPELLENTGHAYNSCGDSAKAEASFEKALSLIKKLDEGKQGESNIGGVLLGLGLVRLNRDAPTDALPVLQEALDFYKRRHTSEHSLQAKAGTSVARAYEALGQLGMAETHYRECVRIFRMTCGSDSPLTANALAKLANVLLAQNKEEAATVMHEALRACVGVDMYSVELRTVAGLLAQLLNTVGPTKLRENAQEFAKLCEIALTKLRERGDKLDDADAAVFYKSYGELTAVAGDIDYGSVLLRDAVRLLDAIPATGADAAAAAMCRERCVELLTVIDEMMHKRCQGAQLRRQHSKGAASAEGSAAGSSAAGGSTASSSSPST